MACGVCGVLRVSFGAAVGVAVIVGEHREWTVYKNHNKSQKKPAKPANLCNFLKTHSFHRRVSLDRNPQKLAKTRRSVLLCGPHSWTLGAIPCLAPHRYRYLYAIPVALMPLKDGRRKNMSRSRNYPFSMTLRLTTPMQCEVENLAYESRLSKAQFIRIALRRAITDAYDHATQNTHLRVQGGEL